MFEIVLSPVFLSPPSPKPVLIGQFAEACQWSFLQNHYNNFWCFPSVDWKWDGIKVETALASASITAKHWDVFYSHPHKVITACYFEQCQNQVAQQRAMLLQRQHIIILSVYQHSRKSFVSGLGAVIVQRSSLVKLILTQVIVSLQAVTSSFGYNYLPRSGILSTFVIETPALPDEINLSYFLCWIFFLLVTDLILTAHQSTAIPCFFFSSPAELECLCCRVDHLQAYLCEWSLLP